MDRKPEYLDPIIARPNAVVNASKAVEGEKSFGFEVPYTILLQRESSGDWFRSLLEATIYSVKRQWM